MPDGKAILRNFFINKLSGAFILISLDKLRKLTGFPNPLNTKGTNFLIGTANFFTRLEIKAQTLSGCFTASQDNADENDMGNKGEGLGMNFSWDLALSCEALPGLA